LWLPLSVLGAAFVPASFAVGFHGWDLHAYWTVNPFDPYVTQTGALSSVDAFFYAPVVAWVMAPLRLLSWPVAQVLWLTLQLACLAYIGRRWALALVVFPPVWMGLVYGNINLMLAAAIVAGFRHPAAWAFVLLTKVTPGVGLAGFAGHREWRAVAVAGALTAVGLVVSLPQLDGWLGVLQVSGGQPIPGAALQVPLVLRMPVAIALAWWGGSAGVRWTVPVASTLAMPVLWPIAFAPLAAIVARPVRHAGSR
jgi:hypothetical protein